MKAYKNYKHIITSNIFGIADKIAAERKPFKKKVKKSNK